MQASENCSATAKGRSAESGAGASAALDELFARRGRRGVCARRAAEHSLSERYGVERATRVWARSS
jgi:hypothetical protein